MAYTQVGACPQCGAPVWVESSWMSILPPPTKRTCSCGSAPAAIKVAPSTAQYTELQTVPLSLYSAAMEVVERLNEDNKRLREELEKKAGE